MINSSGAVTNISEASGSDLNIYYLASASGNAYLAGKTYELTGGGELIPVLRDVFYIGRQTSPDGKEAKNILIKRGNEWHGPEYMYINRRHVVVIEPVAVSSRVAQLIKEGKTQPQSQTQAPQPPPEGTTK